MSFFSKQFIDVIDWVEPEEGILAFRYPMEDREIQNGGKLTVRDSQMAVFVNEGRLADVFQPGLYTLNTNTLPILTYLLNWNKAFGAVRLRAFGIYSYHISDPKIFYAKVSGTRDLYRTGDLEGQLRNSIIGRISDTFANSQVAFLDLAANQIKLAQTMADQLNPTFRELGLALDSFVVENLSLPEELQKVLDERIEMNIVGDMNRYTKFQVAKSIPIAAGNEGGGGIAGMGAGLAAGSA